MKSPTPRPSAQSVILKFNPLFTLLTFQIIYQGKSEHDTIFKPLNYYFQE